MLTWRSSPTRRSACSRPRPGDRGLLGRLLGADHSWGFDLARISVPALLLHRGQDKAVPFSHGQWLAAHVPGVEAWFFDDEGHGMVRENHIGEVHAWLAARP